MSADFHKDGLYGAVGDVVRSLMYNDAYVATKYIDINFIVRATRKLHRRKIDKRGNAEIVVTIGRPNYLERDFIKQCKKAGEKFPVKGIILKYPPEQKKTAKKKRR